MMVIPIVTRKSAGPSLNYDWADVANATGYINFYGSMQYDTSAVYTLSNFTSYSYTLSTTGSAVSGATYAKSIDKDFDVLINRPMTIKGYGIVEVPFSQTTTAGANASMYVVVKVRKWDGVSETDIASGTGLEQAGFTGGPIYQTETIRVTIPETFFKIGEYLRLTIEIWCKETVGGGRTCTAKLAHDPTARSTDYFWNVGGTWDSNYSSRLLFMCPIKINNI